MGVADGIPTGLQTQQRDEKTTGSRITCMLHVPATRLYKVEEVVTEERMGDATFWELAIGTSWSRALPQLSIPGRLEARDGQCTEWAFLFRTVLCYSYNYPLLI